MERAAGIDPATTELASRRSTAELRSLVKLVRVSGFEPPFSSPQTRRLTRLAYTRINGAPYRDSNPASPRLQGGRSTFELPAHHLVEDRGIEPRRVACKASLGPSTSPENTKAAGVSPSGRFVTRRPWPLVHMVGPVGAAAVAMVVWIMFAILTAVPAFAQDAEPYIALPAKEMARLTARDAELDAERTLSQARAAIIEAQSHHIDALKKVITFQDEELARRERITALADEERDVYKARAERIAKDATKGNLMLRVQARAGAGALVGMALSPVFPPAALLGPVLGAAVGLLESLFLD